MADKISYDSGQHAALQDELKKIGDNFDDLITELKNLQTSATDNLKGEAADSLTSIIGTMLGKLETEKSNWGTVTSNATQVETLIKEADEAAKKTVDG